MFMIKGYEYLILQTSQNEPEDKNGDKPLVKPAPQLSKVR